MCYNHIADDDSYVTLKINNALCLQHEPRFIRDRGVQ